MMGTDGGRRGGFAREIRNREHRRRGQRTGLFFSFFFFQYIGLVPGQNKAGVCTVCVLGRWVYEYMERKRESGLDASRQAIYTYAYRWMDIWPNVQVPVYLDT